MYLILNLRFFIIIYYIFLNVHIKSQTDPPELVLIRRIIFTQLQKSQNINSAKSVMQNEYSNSTKFFCDGKMGPGKRSSIRPTSVHELRPGDIDIIMGMGDSLTAGNGIVATSFMEVLIENRGISWSMGGQNNWRKFITLPNILKEFNENIYGYSLNTSLSYERASRFNVAEAGAMSRDLPYQAQVLINRLKHDPKVNMTNDWKVLTILIGANDFCGDMCFRQNPKIIIKNHERELIKTLRILRDNIPRLFVNFVLPPNVTDLRTLTNKPSLCFITNPFECGCFIGQPEYIVKDYVKIIEEWIKLDYEIVNRDEFNKKDFTVNIQPFTTIITPPKLNNGLIDYSYLSVDCFHFSQKLHKRVSISLWNNMLEPDGNKTKTIKLKNLIVKCPTEEMPFLRTRENSKI